MSTQGSKAVVSRLYEEVFGHWDFGVLDELIGADFIGHGTPPGTPAGPAGVKQFYTGMRSAFPDIRYTVDDLVAEDDKAVVRWTWRGTHQGEYYGIPATGRQVAVTGIAIYRVRGGKCVERWVAVNLLGLLRQLGAMLPDTGHPGARS